MKISKVGLSLMVVVFMACLSFSTTHAQDMSIWIGKWFRCTAKYSGYETNESGPLRPHNATEVNYVKVLNVDETNKVVNLLGYSYENGEWYGESGEWRYTGGNSLDFLCYYFAEEDNYRFGFTGRIQGKMKRGILTSATIKSLGGFEWNGNLSASRVTVTCSLIPESKLPPDLPAPPNIQFNSLEFPFLTPSNIERLAAFGIPNWSGSQPHNGIDLVIYDSLSSSKIISPLKGIVQSINASQNPYSNPVNQLILTIEIFFNFEWTVALIFEPGTADDTTKAAQMSAIKVQTGQIVDAGQEIGDLIVGELGYPHLHYMPMRNGQPVCAYTYSSDAARQIFDEIAARSSSETCYENQ